MVACLRVMPDSIPRKDVAVQELRAKRWRRDARCSGGRAPPREARLRRNRRAEALAALDGAGPAGGQVHAQVMRLGAAPVGGALHDLLNANPRKLAANLGRVNLAFVNFLRQHGFSPGCVQARSDIAPGHCPPRPRLRGVTLRATYSPIVRASPSVSSGDGSPTARLLS